jgi:hypothetical protein
LANPKGAHLCYAKPQFETHERAGGCDLTIEHKWSLPCDGDVEVTPPG